MGEQKEGRTAVLDEITEPLVSNDGVHSTSRLLDIINTFLHCLGICSQDFVILAVKSMIKPLQRLPGVCPGVPQTV